MADLDRSMRSSSEWTRLNLRAYNITIITEDVVTFFGIPALPQPSIHQVILDNEEYPRGGIANKDIRNFFFYLEQSMMIPLGKESAVADFTAHLLSLLGYDDPSNHFIRQRVDIPFDMCRGRTSAKANVCVVGRHGWIFLVVQEDKRHLNPAAPEPQLIADAIATFQYRNACLQRYGEQPIQAATIPGITMTGSAPTFTRSTLRKTLSVP